MQDGAAAAAKKWDGGRGVREREIGLAILTGAAGWVNNYSTRPMLGRPMLARGEGLDEKWDDDEGRKKWLKETS